MNKKLGQKEVQADFIKMTQSGLHTAAQLEQGACYRASESWGGGALLKKLERSEERLPTFTCSVEIFELFRKHKKRGNETVREGLERLIRESPDVR
jgi:hypothetical protein